MSVHNNKHRAVSLHKVFLPVLAMSHLLLINGANADALLQPYSSANRQPLVQVYGLPAAQSAQLTSVGHSSAALLIEASSNFVAETAGTEGVFIDGETHRAELQWRQGVADRWELGVNIPYLSHSGGGMDSFIDEWHDFFNLPDGDRPDYPRDQLRFAYQRDGVIQLDLNEPASGLGDVSINAAYQLASTAERQWALRSQVKFATGDAQDLTGSESTDVAISLHISDQSWQVNNLVWHGSAGVLWMDGGEVLDDRREDWVAFGSTTLAWQGWQHVSLKLQLDAHTGFYDSALDEIGGDSVQLLLGGAIKLSERWLVDVVVSEDIAVNTAPDVVFMLGIKAVEL